MPVSAKVGLNFTLFKPCTCAQFAHSRHMGWQRKVENLICFLLSLVSSFSCLSYLFLLFFYQFGGQLDITASLLTGPYNLKSIDQTNWRRLTFLYKSDKLSKIIFHYRILFLLRGKQYLPESIHLTNDCVHMTKIHPSANLQPGYKTFAPPMLKHRLHGQNTPR